MDERPRADPPNDELERFWCWEPRGLRVGVLVGIVLALAAVLCLSNLGLQGLEHDELYTAVFSRLPLGQQVELLREDQHPPLYTFLMHFWLAAGSSDSWVRLPSALFAIGSCWLAFLIGRECLSNAYGLLAALLVAIHPFHSWLAQVGRSYAMFGFEVLLTLYAALRLVRRGGRSSDWALYGVAACLQFYTFYYGYCVVSMLGLLLLVVFADRPQILRRWLAAHLSIVVGYSPWIPVACHQVFATPNKMLATKVPAVGEQLENIARMGATVTEPFWTLSLHSETRALSVIPWVALAAGLTFAAGVAGFRSVRRLTPVPWYFLPAAAAGCFLFPALVSLALNAHFLSWRYQVAASLLGQFVVAAALMWPRRAWVLVVVVLAICRWELALALSLQHTPRDQFREAAAEVAAKARADDALVFSRESYEFIGSHYFKAPGTQCGF
ncbi:MAG: glycosyltransferase family 39 protein, partial [Candidatus Wallbacteria bacterium]|nr:glycosyltransferase family 39 protein [Candidatus Wallbacteria bacterium]